MSPALAKKKDEGTRKEGELDISLMRNTKEGSHVFPGSRIMLDIRNLSVEAEDGRRILKNINLSVPDRSLLVLTGPNGGGKSTLAKTIAGIMSPSEGRILLDGEDITELDITRRSQMGVGFAFQQPVRFKGLTVRDLLTIAAGSPLAEDALYGYLRDVGLCGRDYAGRELGSSLSGGEIKRIEIASVLARNAKLTVFDEPEAGIDLWSFHNLIDVFKRLREKLSGSVLIISHQERILEIADEIAVLADGEIVSAGPAHDILPGLLAEGADCRFCGRTDGGGFGLELGGSGRKCAL